MIVYHPPHETSLIVLRARFAPFSVKMINKSLTIGVGGALTSPYLSNLLTVNMDAAIYKFCAEYGKLRYTRYADDISISGNMYPSYVISEVSRMVSNNYPEVNKEKTAIVRQHDRQLVNVAVGGGATVKPNFKSKVTLFPAYGTRKRREFDGIGDITQSAGAHYAATHKPPMGRVYNYLIQVKIVIMFILCFRRVYIVFPSQSVIISQYSKG